MSYLLDEIKGLEQQLSVLTELINRLREAHALETNPTEKMRLEREIATKEEERRVALEKLRQAHDINTPSGGTFLEQEVARLLKIDEPLGRLHLVNCDRIEMTRAFWQRYDDFSSKQKHFQFYFIAACNKQMPQSFSERMVYELIEEELDSDDSVILAKPDGERIKREDLPIGRNLEKSRERFKSYFAEAERFGFKEPQSFDDFLKTGLPRMNYKYVVTIFTIPEKQWEEPHLPDYLAWIMDCFTGAHEDVPVFLFYFSFYMDGMHDSATPKQQRFLDELDKLTEKYDLACVLKPLQPVPYKDLDEWLRSLGEENSSKREELIKAYAKGLDRKLQERLLNDGLIDMDRVIRLQELIYNWYHRKGNSL